MPYDPVCGKKVKAESPYTYEFHGKTYHFCSEDCRNDFSQNPRRYVVENRESGGC